MLLVPPPVPADIESATVFNAFIETVLAGCEGGLMPGIAKDTLEAEMLPAVCEILPLDSIDITPAFGSPPADTVPSSCTLPALKELIETRLALLVRS